MRNWIGREWIGFVGRSFSGENSPEFLGVKEDLRSFLDLLVWKLILILFPFVIFMGKLKGFFSVSLCSAWWLLLRILSLVKVSWFFFIHWAMSQLVYHRDVYCTELGPWSMKRLVFDVIVVVSHQNQKMVSNLLLFFMIVR